MYFIRREDIGFDLDHGGREMMSGFTSRKATSTNQTNTVQGQHERNDGNDGWQFYGSWATPDLIIIMPAASICRRSSLMSTYTIQRVQ